MKQYDRASIEVFEIREDIVRCSAFGSVSGDLMGDCQAEIEDTYDFDWVSKLQ